MGSRHGACTGVRPRRKERPLFAAAQQKDLGYMRALIREGARMRSFDEALAADSMECETFFAGFAEVLTRKMWTRPASPGHPAHSPARAFLYQQTSISSPIGFVAIRGIGSLGYELWLTAIDRDIRGRGLGRRMLADFLATEDGKRTTVAQCRLDSPGAQACAHILSTLGFVTARVGQLSLWLARADLPSDALEWMRTVPLQSDIKPR
jgi:GNAT superfamily N-acetyltransferase